MPRTTLQDIALPEFGIAETLPVLDDGFYRTRLDRLRARMKDAGLDVLAIYADREHFANLAWVTGFDPRFEEALMLLADGRDPVILTGPENQGTARRSAIDVEVLLYPPFGLLGQDRTRTPVLADLLRSKGVAAGGRIGVAGWKYYGALESPTPDTWIEAPSYIVDTLRGIAGPSGAVVNASAIFMDASEGLRAINEIDQLALFEFASCRTSESVKSILRGVRPGMRELEAARLAGTVGLPLNCHPMLSTGERAHLGLLSPSDRVMQRGDIITTAFGVWGALNARGGWLIADESELPAAAADYLEKLAIPYFECAAEWYETVGIGVEGGTLDAQVKARLGDPFYGVGLNPGHLLHLDEWMNTPIYPGSTETLKSGQAIQIDIIPATGTAYFTTNIEDGIALLDAPGRAVLAERHPGAWARIEARRAFMADAIGIRLKPEVLPFSNIPAYLPPFFLSPGRVLTRR